MLTHNQKELEELRRINMKTLNDKILLVVARYYFNRSNHRAKFCPTCKQRLPDKPLTGWDKDADLSAIDAESSKAGWFLIGSAGTFWFSRKLKSGSTLTIKLNEGNYLNGGLREVKS